MISENNKPNEFSSQRRDLFSKSNLNEDISRLKEFLESEKLEDIRYYDVPANWLMGAFVCTATSVRHIDAVADRLKRFRINDNKMVIDGEGEWVIAFAGGYFVHLFTQQMRDYYTLDELWEKTKRREE